jgi:hypothetical protein
MISPRSLLGGRWLVRDEARAEEGTALELAFESNFVPCLKGRCELPPDSFVSNVERGALPSPRIGLD